MSRMLPLTSAAFIQARRALLHRPLISQAFFMSTTHIRLRTVMSLSVLLYIVAIPLLPVAYSLVRLCILELRPNSTWLA